jgi:uncharacterized membrane protein
MTNSTPDHSKTQGRGRPRFHFIRGPGVLRLPRIRGQPGWRIPLAYALAAITVGLILPRVENRWLSDLPGRISAPAAMAIYGCVGSGMMTFTGIVFSLTFVMIQFNATAYSPRLVRWISHDRLPMHAIGVFTATFVYAIAALAWVDRSGSNKAPLLSAWLVVALVLASVIMFVALIKRISRLQIRHVLSFTGDHGRRVIKKLYARADTAAPAASVDEFMRLPVTQTLLYEGTPRTVQAIDEPALVAAAAKSGAFVEIVAAVGDSVSDGTTLLRVRGGHRPIKVRRLRKALEIGEERTFEQDPLYAIRLLVDIAIRALSPAVNDPTTAVQALDQIEDLLLRLGRRHVELGELYDRDGVLRVVVPFPTWEDFLTLAFNEIRFYGATSVQVMRRMSALIANLIEALPAERHAAVRHERERLERIIARTYPDAEEIGEASVEDRQGLGARRRHTAN